MKKLNKIALIVSLFLGLLMAGCSTASHKGTPSPSPGVASVQTGHSLPPTPPTPSVPAKKLKGALVGGYYVITNPPPSVTVAWDPPVGLATNDTITNYNLYVGTASGKYTMSVPVGTVTTATFTGTFGTNQWLTGVVYYMAATAVDKYGLESTFSSEVTWMFNSIPLPPGMHPIVQVAIDSTPSLTPPVTWYPTGFAVYLPSDQVETQMFRLRISP